MELCYLKGDALAALKKGLPTTYEKYLTERDNSWVVEVCGENPRRRRTLLGGLLSRRVTL